MYSRNVKQYEQLTSQPETCTGGYVLMVAVVVAIMINVYMGVSRSSENLNDVMATQADMQVQLAALNFRN